MKKVDKLWEKIDNVNNAVNQSPQWIEKQKQKLLTKIDDLIQRIKKWLEDQMDKVQNWLDNIKNEILDFISKLLLSPILALTGI